MKGGIHGDQEFLDAHVVIPRAVSKQPWDFATPQEENKYLQAEVERLRQELEHVRSERDRLRDAVEILRVELKR